MSAQVEEMEFATETRQLLDLMVHSIYSNKDSFLRELVSNSSDALDKLRMETFRDKDLAADISDLHIQISLDPEARTFTLADNGIGMSRAEVVDLIGTLARSGTAEVRKKLKEATRWESAGEGTYTIEDIADAPQGTTVTLHLKPEDAEDDLHDYTSVSKVRELVKKYSDFISWPIRMDVPTPPAPSAPTADEDSDGEEKAEAEPAPIDEMWIQSIPDFEGKPL